MKSILFITLLFLDFTCFAQDKGYILEGTIGKYPIVLQLSVSIVRPWQKKEWQKGCVMEGTISPMMLSSDDIIRESVIFSSFLCLFATTGYWQTTL